MKTIFWNVDTQYDFMRNDDSFKGALPVIGAREIEKNLEQLTIAAKKYNIQVINTGDWHTPYDKEIDVKNPDFKTTYPPHCMKNTKGAEYVPATNPETPYVVSWEDAKFDATKVSDSRNVVLYKNEFSVFEGSKHTEEILNIINPDRTIVYGVATNVCVNFAVQGLLERNKEVYVVRDAIKELPAEIAATSLEDVLKTWENKGAKFIDTKDITKYIRS